MTTLAPSTDYTGAAVTQGGKKTFIATLRTFIADCLGTDSTPATVRTTLGSLLQMRNRPSLFVNGSCQIAQRIGTVNLSTAKQVGQVDMVSLHCSTGAVSAGTLTQQTASLAGTTGYAARAAGCTLTGAAVLSATFRMEARDAKRYKNQNCSFQVAVAHDVGSNVNYTIVLKKATAADNWASTTTIATSGATAVATATGTVLKFENQSMGDCSNGIEVEVLAACGAVTTKNFDFTEFSLDTGAFCPPFAGNTAAQDLAQCGRYLPAWQAGSTTEWVSGEGLVLSGTTAAFLIRHPVKTRVPTTAFTGSNSTHFSINASAGAGAASAVALLEGGSFFSRLNVTTGGTMTAGQAAHLYLNNATSWFLLTGAELF